MGVKLTSRFDRVRSASDPSRKSRNVRPESEMRGKTDISGFDYHEPQRMDRSSRACRQGRRSYRSWWWGTRYNTTIPFQVRCRLPTAGQPGAKELMTAVRVSEPDGMLAPQPLTLRASCLKAPRGAFVL